MRQIQNVMFDRIEKEVTSHDVVLYMNGTAAFPRCSSSALIVQILSQLKIAFRDVNTAEDSELRKGLKDFAKWPSPPQLYIKGEFAGGGDIVREMYENGEFQQLLADKGIMP